MVCIGVETIIRRRPDDPLPSIQRTMTTMSWAKMKSPMRMISLSMMMVNQLPPKRRRPNGYSTMPAYKKVRLRSLNSRGELQSG